VPLGELTAPVLHSRDLMDWRLLGNALTLHGAFEALWAPEVAYDNGTFYIYYSAGGKEGKGHQLRVATATRPTGPFEDSGTVLTPDDPFTIDAHPFRDDDGHWYLYYCRDFLNSEGGERVGTGIVVDRLVGMTRLAGERTMVVRPHADWQLYQRQRRWYGRVWDWYTVEGPFVHKHGGRYYCFYSGGAWREPNYGVSYVVADHPMGPFASEAGADGPEILRTKPGRVIGPGHASVVHAPDNVGQYIVYHAWDQGHTARLIRMDRLNWGEEGPFSSGPTLDPEPAPPLPSFCDGFDGPDGAPPDSGAWQVAGGDWRQRNGELVQHDFGARPATALLANMPPYEEYFFEANVRLLEASHEHSRYGLYLGHGPGDLTHLVMTADGFVTLCGRERDLQEPVGRYSLRALGPGFRNDAYHQLLVSVRNGKVEVQVDRVSVMPGVEVPPGAVGIGLFTWEASAAFDGVSVTPLMRGSR